MLWKNIKHQLKRKISTKLSLAVLSIFSLLLAQFGWPIQTTHASTLTTPRIYLGRQGSNVASANSFQIFFTTVNTVSSGGKVVIIFPNDANNNTKWCRTTGSDLVATGIANPTGGSETATSLTSSSSFTTACTQSPDTFTISNVAALSTTTKYGVQIAQAGSPTALIGTANTTGQLSVTIKTQTGAPADVDTGTATIYLVSNDQVSVTATVQPTLTVSLSGNSVPLGTLDSTHINYVGVTSTVSANGVGGYVSLVNYNNTLTDANSDTIANSGSSVTAGTAGYGAATSQAGNTLNQSNNSVACDTTQRQQTGTANSTTLSTSFQSFAASASPVTSQVTTLCYEVAIAFNTPPGSYTSTSTVVTTGRF